ncbi:hypothetical protein CEXT_211651 [Caerostris extrusa]|uniref:C2H2-type domain-containing protein n=1 Tax=Caerostris extrusa TaxID=172846 RepID=A0AAV4PXM7_CAEEX|nr:hypothetical protein CEXT_211651 [Caerostris extrusa]
MHVASAHTGGFRHNCALCGKGFHAPGLLRDYVQKKHQETRGSDEDVKQLHLVMLFSYPTCKTGPGNHE